MARAIRQELGLSERRVCGLLGLARSTYRYRGERVESDLLVRLRALAEQWPRYGYRRLHLALRREGIRINHKRVYRLYRLQGLALRRRTRKRAAGLRALPLIVPSRRNQRWAMDFLSDSLASGRRFRVLMVLDVGIRKALALEVDTSLPGARVVRVLEQLIAEHGTPELIVIDNGPEFAGRLLDQWAYAHGIKLHFIDPGKPVQNAYVESFAGRLRDECLNGHWFTTLDDAQHTIETWRREYNEVRPHSALGDRSPEEFARLLEQEELAPGAAVTL